MTEKEKAKAYDEAIERAKKLYSNGVAEKIFPELKEDDDEKIRKWIIDDIRCNIINKPLNNSEYKKKAEKAIAWLESTKFALENQWISVKDDLPCNHKELICPNDKRDTVYVVAVIHGYIILSRMYKLEGKWSWENDEPTHWMSIPKLP